MTLTDEAIMAEIARDLRRRAANIHQLANTMLDPAFEAELRVVRDTLLDAAEHIDDSVNNTIEFECTARSTWGMVKVGGTA